MAYSNLETDLIAWFKTHTEDVNLRAQLERARAGERTVSPTGEFLRFVVPEDCTLVQEDDDALVLLGPGIDSPSLPNGAESNILVRDGVLDHLEVYTFGDAFSPDLSDYSLVDV